MDTVLLTNLNVNNLKAAKGITLLILSLGAILDKFQNGSSYSLM